MKKIFHIENSLPTGNPRVLYLRIGEKHASFAVTGESGLELYQLAYCVLDNTPGDGWNEKELAAFEAACPVLRDTYEQVLVAYDFPQSLLVSSLVYKQEDAAHLLYTTGAVDMQLGADLLNDWQLYNVYAINQEVAAWVTQLFPAAVTCHQFSAGIKKMTPPYTGETLTVDFRTSDFTVMARKGHQLVLAQTFNYATPDDVLYYLLNTCQRFALSQQELQLQLSGLIDKRSSLYNELYQYFIHVEFRETDWKDTGDYPAHFFTSLNDLVRCAS